MKLRGIVLSLFVTCFIIGCSKAQEKPDYLSWEQDKDSIKVFIENSYLCPMFFFYQEKGQRTQILDLEGKERRQIVSAPITEIDSTNLFDKYSFLGMGYGNRKLQSYDTLYNYGLPFLKGKSYKVMQGQNTNGTHQGDFSRYAIDFKMNVGQTICAIREGLVVKVKEHNTKGGRGKKYFNYANLIIVYHSDGTFAQYVHLKHKGSLVKVGDTVKKGQPIGYSGNTGQSTGPHLHFAVYKPTTKRLVSIPYILDSIPTKKYVKGKYAVNN